MPPTPAMRVLRAVFVLACSVCPPVLTPAAAEQRAADSLTLTEPPDDWELDEFYQKHMSVSGLPVVGSEKVSDYAIKEAAHLVRSVLQRRPDVLRAMVNARVRVAVMAVEERTTDVPEHRDLEPARFWNRRARGLGATPQRPVTSCGEENLLCYRGDPYQEESILVHEFAHTIHQMGLRKIDPRFDAELKQTYRASLADGLWKGAYAATNPAEFWAEGVQSYFNTNRADDDQHNHVVTREELQEYDPALFALIDEAFRQNPWRYQAPHDRDAIHRRHLQGYDPAQAPAFAWEPKLQAWYDVYTRQKSGK